MHFQKGLLTLFFLTLFISCSTFDFTVADIKDYPAGVSENLNVAQEKYPESNAVILFHGTYYVITGIEDGKIAVKVRTRIVKKIFKTKTYSETNRLHVDDNGRLLSVSARLIKKNGEVKHVPEKDIFKTATTFYYQNDSKENTSVLFSDLNAEDGDIVDKEYEFIWKEPYSFSVQLLNIDGDIPVLRREINITYKDGFFENEGKGWFLRYKYVNKDKGSVSESVENGFKNIRFIEKDLPERKNDTMTEYGFEGVRSFLLSVSRYNSWESLSQYYFDKSIAPALSRSDSNVLKNAVFKNTKTNSKKKEQIGDIVKYVRKLQYDSVKSAYVDQYSILSPSKTVQLQKGNDRDKALLLSELLKSIDVKSELVFINDRYGMKIVDDFPDIMFFGRMIVRIKDPDNDEKWLYLDPNERDNPPFFQSSRNSGVAGLVIGKDVKNAMIRTDEYKNEQVSEISERIIVKMISLEKAEVEVTIVARNENYSRFKKMEELNALEVKKELIEYVFYREDLVDITEYKIVPDENSGEVSVTFKAELTPPVLKNSGKYYFTDIISSFGFYGPLFRADKKRSSPIFLGRLRTVEWMYEIILPEGYEFLDQTAHESEISLDGIIKETTRTKTDLRKYVKTSTISYLKSVIPPENEKDYSDFLYKTGKQTDSAVFIKKEGDK